MANANTEHSKKLRQATAAKWQKEQLAKGLYKQLTIKGKAEDMNIIEEAIKKAGGSKARALKAICEDFLKHS